MAVALLSCVALAGAQGGGQGRGQGRRGGGGNSELSLAMRADVQKEISVTDDQKTKLTDLQQKSRPQRGGGGGGGNGGGGGGGNGGGNFDPAAMAQRMAEMRAQQHKDLSAILNDGQMKRLGELLIQREGYNALTQPDVQKALNFTSDQTQKVKDLATKQQEANRALMEKMRNQEITREELTADREKNTKTMNDELSKVLTSDQASKFKEMQGKPFTFETGNGGGGGL